MHEQITIDESVPIGSIDGDIQLVAQDVDPVELQEEVQPEPKIKTPPVNQDLVEELRVKVRAGEPWDKKSEARLADMRPAKLAELLRKLSLRMKLYNPPKEWGNVPEFLEVIRLSNQRKNPLQFRPADMLLKLRQQFMQCIRGFSVQNVLRMRHVFSVHLDLPVVRLKRKKFLAMTFVPGRHKTVFQQGNELVDVSNFIVASLAMRRHALMDGTIIDMADVRLHGAGIDPESRIPMIGGAGTVGEEARQFSRCLLSRYFNLTPFQGADRRILDSGNVSLYEAALSMYESVEDAIVSGAAVQAVPEFPRFHLVFPSGDSVDFERTTSLEDTAFRRVDKALRKGETPYNAEIMARIQRCRSWKELETQLGEEDANHLLLDVWTGEEKKLADGTRMIPLDFFNVYSGQNPVRRSLRVVAEMMEYHKGRRVMIQDGTMASDNCLARCQVVRMPSPEALTGNIRGVDYDFSSVPVGQEVYFQNAE